MKLSPIIDLLVFVVNKNDVNKLNQILNENPQLIKLSLNAKGSADTDAGDFWGFGVVDNEIVFAISTCEKNKEILEKVNKELHMEEKSQGLAFSVPISSATTDLISKYTKKEK